MPTCKKCESQEVSKNGFVRCKQRNLCKTCDYNFVSVLIPKLRPSLGRKVVLLIPKRRNGHDVSLLKSISPVESTVGTVSSSFAIRSGALSRSWMSAV